MRNRAKENSCGFESVNWQYAFLKHTIYRSVREAKAVSLEGDNSSELFQKGRFRVKNADWQIKADRKTILLSAVAGKVTDAGYDQMLAVYTSIPSELDVSISARIRINRFCSERTPNGQEAFGIFLRDTIRPDPFTGMMYSNMAAVGGWRNELCLYGREGVLAESTEDVRMFCHPVKTDNDSLWNHHGDQQPPIICDMTLSLKTGRLYGEMTCTSDPGIRTEPDQKMGNMQMQQVACNFLTAREQNHYYIGFFVTRGTEIVIDKKSVRIMAAKRKNLHAFDSGEVCLSKEIPIGTEGNELRNEERLTGMGEICQMMRRDCYVFPDTCRESDGSRERPFTLEQALQKMDFWQRILLLPGSYRLDKDIVIAKQMSGTADVPRFFGRAKDTIGEVLLDFSGSSGALKIHADHWIIDGITVAGGMGIQVQGSHNRVRNCMATQNVETGILIRHEQINAPRNVWPSDNLIENCISCRNVDLTGQNADGFACKVAAGDGNRFLKCVSFLNADDGFDLFAKNRRIGAVSLEKCVSFLNGYAMDASGKLTKKKGNGNGFKLGGSGLAIAHTAVNCSALKNKCDGFTSNSNPWLSLTRCRSTGNGGKNLNYYFTGSRAEIKKNIVDCEL